MCGHLRRIWSSSFVSNLSNLYCTWLCPGKVMIRLSWLHDHGSLSPDQSEWILCLYSTGLPRQTTSNCGHPRRAPDKGTTTQPVLRILQEKTLILILFFVLFFGAFFYVASGVYSLISSLSSALTVWHYLDLTMVRYPPPPHLFYTAYLVHRYNGRYSCYQSYSLFLHEKY